MDDRAGAFSRIELLAIVLVLVHLGAITFPTFNRAARSSRSVRCMNNLRIIGLAALTYADDQNDSFHYQDFGGRAQAPNGGKWRRNPASEKELAANDGEAYWGIAYRPYLPHPERTRKHWRCPSARTVDEWRETGLRYPSAFWLDSSYGLNQYAVAHFEDPSAPGPRRLAGFESPAATVFAQDAAEPRMEGADDSLGLFPGKTECLTQWKQVLAPLYPGLKMETEWFRHPACNTVWIDGHVSAIRFTSEGIDYRKYTGQRLH